MLMSIVRVKNVSDLVPLEFRESRSGGFNYFLCEMGVIRAKAAYRKRISRNALNIFQR